MTQREQILELLRERGKAGVFVYEMMIPKNQGGMGIAQYNARIKELRDKGFKIINTHPGHFVLEEVQVYKEEPLEDATAQQLAFA